MPTKQEMAPGKEELVVGTTLLAGRILMECGSETSRVESTMEHIIRHSMGEKGNQRQHIFVMLNGIFVTLPPLHASFLQVTKRNYNLNKVSQVNQISRDLAAGDIDLQETNKRLLAVDAQKPPFFTPLQLLCTALLSGSAALLFGASPAAFPVAAAAGLVSFFFYSLISRFLDMPFIAEFAATFSGSLAGYFLSRAVGAPIDFVMIGAVIPLVPGIAVTNAIRDIMDRHYLTGMMRFLECLFIAASLGAGVALVYFLF